MATILVLYGTGEGQTATVAERIAEALRARGHDAEPVDVASAAADVDLAAYDAVLVGASIHRGKHQRSVVDFVRANRERLAAVPTAFFQVSLSSATEEGEAEAAGYVESFVEATDWHPDRIGQFGGALRFSEYGFLTRLMMKQIAKRAMPDVDTSRDVEFTDWDEVDAFANDVAAFVEGRLGLTAPSGPSTGG